MLSTTVCDQTFWLHPFRAVFWKEREALLLADLHLGKVSHFRRAGIPVPRAAADANWDRLLSLLFDLSPREVFFLGDLFHSDYNAEWDDLADIIRQFSATDFHLILGNHDILGAEAYRRAGLQVHPEKLELGPFRLTHAPEEEPEAFYNLAGHIHPGVMLRGNGRQKRKLPCFFFGHQQAILPAFGSFTGLALVEARRSDRVFVLAGAEVMEV